MTWEAMRIADGRDPAQVERTVALLRSACAAAPTTEAAVLDLVEAAEGLCWCFEQMPADAACDVVASLARVRNILAAYSHNLASVTVAGRC